MTVTVQASIEVKECPFCGGEPVPLSYWGKVACGNYNCPLWRHPIEISVWNTRASSSTEQDKE